MRWKNLDSTNGHRTLVLVFEQGDEVVAGLRQFAREQRLDGCQLTAIGAFQKVVLGYWDWDKKDYDRIEVPEQVEVLSLLGNVARAPDPEGGYKVHAHVVVGKRDATAHGGHLLEAHVRPTLEVILTETPSHLQRQLDSETHLALLVP